MTQNSQNNFEKKKTLTLQVFKTYYKVISGQYNTSISLDTDQ